MRWMGRSLSNLFAGIAALMMIAVAVTWATNYTLTQGAGTTFGSLVVAGVNYAQHFICDATTPSQCAAVSSGGAIKVDNSAVTQPVSVGTWAAGTLGAMANYGTSPGAVLVPGVNAFVTNASPNGAHNTANSPTVNLATDQTAADPCMFQAKTNLAFSTNPNNANVALVAAVSAKKVYVCSFSVIAAAATAVSLTEGSGATCGTSNQAAVIGVASNGTLANGLSLAANGGLTLGNGGNTIAATATANDTLCIAGSASANLAGNLTYIQQ